MKNFKRIREDIITIALLLITLTFTSSNFTPELLEDNSFTQRRAQIAVSH